MAATISNKIRAGRNIKSTTHKVVANFTNGFAQNVIELESGTLLLISYHGDKVEIVERELISDPAEITDIVNATPDSDE